MTPENSDLPKRQRVAAYAVIVRAGRDGEDILLSRLAPRVSETELWTLPGGGIDFGEDPGDAVIREVYEETGLQAMLGAPFWVGSARRDMRDHDWHSIRIVFDAYVPATSGPPRVIEVDGSTVDARWWPVRAVLDASVPTVTMVGEALAAHRPAQRQRLAAYALAVRDAEQGREMLLTRISARGHHPGAWTLPGGGVDHGESPEAAVAREVVEETGLHGEVGELLGVHDLHFTGTAPSGRIEDFHGVHLVFATTVDAGEPQVRERGGTTDAVAWVPLVRVAAGELEVLDVVGAAIRMDTRAREAESRGD